jgi:geranylgeranyl diphosphate synthase, type I
MSACNQGSDPRLDSLLQATELFMLDKLDQADAQRLRALIHYHLESGGARVRARLALSAGLALQLSEQTCVSLAASCELIHNASLLHDDIQDGDRIRRGQRAAWCEFDTNTAMCAGTLMLSTAYEVLLQTPAHTHALLAHVHQRTADLIAGQTLDLDPLDKHLDLQVYLNIATKKSGSLLALPLELVMICAEQTDYLATAKAAGDSFAIAYQIIDDVSDLDADLTKDHNNIVRVMMQNGIERTESIEQARDMARAHLTVAIEHAAKLPNLSGVYLTSLCEALAHSAVTAPDLRCESL